MIWTVLFGCVARAAVSRMSGQTIATAVPSPVVTNDSH